MLREEQVDSLPSSGRLYLNPIPGTVPIHYAAGVYGPHSQARTVRPDGGRLATLLVQSDASPGSESAIPCLPGGFRTIIVFRWSERAVFVYGFGKNERDNIREDELQEFRRLATVMLNYDDTELRAAIEHGALIEVSNG